MKINELKSVMAKRGVTQRGLAKLTGMNRNTLAGKMSGKRPFNVEEAETICDALGITDYSERAYIFLSE